MPDRMSSSGVPNAPSARITSRAAQVSRTDLRTVCRTDTHRVPVKPSRTAREPVSTVRFGGGTGAGSPAPTGTWPGAAGGAHVGRSPSTTLYRRPSAMLRLASVAPQVSPEFGSSSLGSPSSAASSNGVLWAWFQMAVGAVATAHSTTTTDDPANPGSSRVLNDVAALDVAPRDGQLGAPILDGAGRLIGVVIAAGPQVYGADMADAQPSVQQLIDSGHVSHPWLGFNYRQLGAPEAADRGVPAGVEVVAVPAGSAAARAGVASGDIVVSANGTNLDPTHPLSRLLRGMAVGQTVSLSVKTPSTRKSVSVTVALLSP